MHESLIKMLNRLLEDMLTLHQQGAGYYSCTPIIQRYNKLLIKAREVVPAAEDLINTFEDIPEADPKDPADKQKIVQGIRIEIGQLICLLSSLERTA